MCDAGSNFYLFVAPKINNNIETVALCLAFLACYYHLLILLKYLILSVGGKVILAAIFGDNKSLFGF